MFDQSVLQGLGASVCVHLPTVEISNLHRFKKVKVLNKHRPAVCIASARDRAGQV